MAREKKPWLYIQPEAAGRIHQDAKRRNISICCHVRNILDAGFAVLNPEEESLKS